MKKLSILFALVATLVFATSAQAAKVYDVTRLSEVQKNDLVNKGTSTNYVLIDYGTYTKQETSWNSNKPQFTKEEFKEAVKNFKIESLPLSLQKKYLLTSKSKQSKTQKQFEKVFASCADQWYDLCNKSGKNPAYMMAVACMRSTFATSTRSKYGDIFETGKSYKGNTVKEKSLNALKYVMGHYRFSALVQVKAMDFMDAMFIKLRVPTVTVVHRTRSSK